MEGSSSANPDFPPKTVIEEKCPTEDWEDDDAYIHIKLPMKDVKICRPYVSSDVLKSPIIIDGECLGNNLILEERILTNLVWGHRVHNEYKVFDDGKLQFDKETAMTCYKTRHLQDTIVDAFCDALHRRQIKGGGIKRLFFPCSLAQMARDDLGSNTVPDHVYIETWISKIMEAISGVVNGKFTDNECDYYFFPYCRSDHFLTFCIDMKAEKYIYMNSMHASTGFEQGDKFTMKRVFKYFLTYMQNRRPNVKWSECQWEVAGLIEQKDTYSSALFTIWFMEHWENDCIPEHIQSEYLSDRNLANKRRKVLAEILMQPENTELEGLKELYGDT